MVEAVVLGVLFVIVAAVPMWLYYARRRSMRRIVEIFRSAALDATGGPPTVIMDIGVLAAKVSVLASAEGDASLYTSVGGGVLGGIEHESVREAAKVFVSVAQSFLSRLKPASEHPYPETGEARFYLRMPQELYAASAPVRDLDSKRSELWPLWFAGQNVITQLRLISERK